VRLLTPKNDKQRAKKRRLSGANYPLFRLARAEASAGFGRLRLFVFAYEVKWFLRFLFHDFFYVSFVQLAFLAEGFIEFELDQNKVNFSV
jgi:hypothetical protein